MMPNTPEAIISFYAVNKIGAIANMVHPLSSEEELKNSLISTKSVLLIAVNIAYNLIDNIIDDTKIYKTVLVSPKDSMPKIMNLLYTITKDLKNKIPKSNERYLYWNSFMERGKDYKKSVFVPRSMNDDAIYLHSGGTTGTPKNIVITNMSVNAIMDQAQVVFPKIGEKDIVLGILPMFHSFGLLVSIAAPLCMGSTIVMVPQFDAKRFDKLLRKYNPTILIGVPTLFEALITNPYMINLDLSQVKYVISGGDSLSSERNKRLNDFLESHNCHVKVIQGYGLTETSGPCCIGSFGANKLGSIGIPLPSVVIKIMNHETMEELAPFEIGEMCISGPNVMSRYLDNEKETNDVIKKDENGVRWVKTGDLAYMDNDGVIFFVQRLKRMIISSGYNVYPSHIEDILIKHPKVEMCGVIGIPHPYKVQVAKAFIVLKNGIEANNEIEKELIKYCEKNLAKYMIPKKFEFRKTLPKTMVGKVNYRELEKEELNK
jgi:long-chain acyl-CoA synthetase